MYTVLAPICTHDLFTETLPAYETPLPHPAAINIPQEVRQTVDIMERRRQDSEEAPHGGTKTLAANPHRAQQDLRENSQLHSKHPQEGEELNPSLNDKKIEHTEMRLQESG